MAPGSPSLCLFREFLLFYGHMFLSMGFSSLISIMKWKELRKDNWERDQGMGEGEGRLVRINSLISAWSFHFAEILNRKGPLKSSRTLLLQAAWTTAMLFLPGFCQPDSCRLRSSQQSFSVLHNPYCQEDFAQYTTYQLFLTAIQACTFLSWPPWLQKIDHDSFCGTIYLKTVFMLPLNPLFYQ